MTDLIIQSLEEEHDGAGAVVGGDGGGAQLVDVATVVHVDSAGLIGLKSNDGLCKEYLRRRAGGFFCNSTSNIGKVTLYHPQSVQFDITI